MRIMLPANYDLDLLPHLREHNQRRFDGNLAELLFSWGFKSHPPRCSWLHFLRAFGPWPPLRSQSGFSFTTKDRNSGLWCRWPASQLSLAAFLLRDCGLSGTIRTGRLKGICSSCPPLQEVSLPDTFCNGTQNPGFWPKNVAFSHRSSKNNDLSTRAGKKPGFFKRSGNKKEVLISSGGQVS